AANQAADRPVVEKGVAEVEAGGAKGPTAPLRGRTAIEVEPGACSRNFFRPRSGAKVSSDVAWRQTCQQQRTRRHRYDEQQREEETSRQEPDHFTERASAFHSAGGRCTDGITPTTRALCA